MNAYIHVQVFLSTPTYHMCTAHLHQMWMKMNVPSTHSDLFCCITSSKHPLSVQIPLLLLIYNLHTLTEKLICTHIKLHGRPSFTVDIWLLCSVQVLFSCVCQVISLLSHWICACVSIHVWLCMCHMWCYYGGTKRCVLTDEKKKSFVTKTTSRLASPACLQTACRCCFVVFHKKKRERRGSRRERRKRTWERQISKDWDRRRERGGEPLLCINSLFASQNMLFPMRLDW